LNVFDLVKADHKYVEDLYTAYCSVSDLVEKRHIGSIIIRSLSVHAVAEEASWYKVLKEKLRVTGNQLYCHSMEEHDRLKKSLSQLDSMSVANRDFDHQLCEVMKVTRHHVEEEEKKVMPPLEKHCSEEEMKQMKSDWFDAKSKAPTHPHPWAPTSEVGAKVASAILKPFDSLKDSMQFGDRNKNEQMKTEQQIASGPATKFKE